VIKNTGLAELWQKGVYAPLTENEAITRCAEIIVYFSENSIKVIKCGLHPSEGLLSGSDTLAGPFHPAFGYKVESRIFAMILEKINKADGVKAVRYNPSDEPAVYGYKRCNAFLLNELSKKNVIIHKDNKVPIGTILI
jgi:histone acetyltransferase (RNA polymerase elongator complex component)